MTAQTKNPRQHILERYIKAAKKAGMEIGAVEIKPDGTISILTPVSANVAADPFEDWEKGEGKE